MMSYAQLASSDGGARRRMMPLLLPMCVAAAIFGSLNLAWATARRSRELDGASQFRSLQPPSALASSEHMDDAELRWIEVAESALDGRYDTSPGRVAPDEEVVALLDSMPDNNFGNVQCTEVSYALCDVSTCTLASDVGVAICGCISKRASASDTASLAVGWASGLLARADPYVQWLRELNTTWHDTQGTGDDEALATVESYICPYLRDARLWGAIGAKRISLFGSDSPQVDDATETVEACADTVGANCQGAPCFDVAYDGVFNVTCLCQRTERDTQYVTRSTMSDGASSFSCSDINSTHCGVVSGTAYPEEWGVVSRQIEVITENYASLLVDSDPGKCPATA